MSRISSENTISVKFSCNIQGDLKTLYLIFSINNGNSWYRVKMKKIENKYAVLVPNIEIGTRILYVFKAVAPNGQEILDNNNGKFYSQIARDKSVKSLPIPTPVENSQRISPSKTSSQLDRISKKFSTDNEKKQMESTETKKISHDSNLPPEFMKKSNPFLSEPSNLQPSNKNAKINHDLPSEVTKSESSNESVKKISIPSTNMEKFAPIIPFNPFPADYGDIKIKSDPLLLFSEIIDDQITNPNSITTTFNSSENEKKRKCTICGANLHSKWNRCPICGN